MNPVSDSENLKREIGVRSLTLAIINITIGTGIFVIPALVAENLGATAMVTYFVCGALIFLIALCFAELGSKITTSGGAYTYIETAFGPYAGFIANNIYWFGACVLGDAAIANALADTMKFFFPQLNNEWLRILFFAVVFGSLALLNIRSVKHGVRFVEFTALGKLLPLLLLVVIGAGSVSSQNLTWVIAPTIENIGAASLLLFFAFMGFETPLSNGGEMKNASRTVPLGIFLGISSILILYLGIQIVTQGVLGNTLALHKDAPLAAVAGIIFGKAGIVFIILATIISMLGALGGEILSIPRILYAGARDGLMPKALAKIHPRFFTPYVSVIFYASLGFFFAAIGGFKQLAIIASASVLLIYLGAVLSMLKLRNGNSSSTPKTYRVPGGIIIPIIAIGAILWLLNSLTKQEIYGILIFTGIFSILYFIRNNFYKNNV